jgi:hypothetical protein
LSCWPGPAARLSHEASHPKEIEFLPPTGAGAGTSGVTGIQTRVQTEDPKQPGLYIIQLTVPANTKIEAHHWLMEERPAETKALLLKIFGNQ